MASSCGCVALEEGSDVANFGSDGGPGIANKDTILAEVCLSFLLPPLDLLSASDPSLPPTQVDAALGVHKPPDLEYLLVRPAASFSIFGYGLSYNSYGHAAVRYRYKGRDLVMNICGKKSNVDMV